MARQTTNQQTNQGTSKEEQYTAGTRQGTSTQQPAAQQAGTQQPGTQGTKGAQQPAGAAGRGESERAVRTTRERCADAADPGRLGRRLRFVLGERPLPLERAECGRQYRRNADGSLEWRHGPDSRLAEGRYPPWWIRAQ